MKRSVSIGVVTLGLLATIAFGAWSSPATAQNSTDDRVSALETQVASLSDRVATLEAKRPSQSAKSTAPAEKGGSGGLQLSGEGQTATDVHKLSGGTYRIAASSEGGGFFQAAAVQTSDGKETTLLFGAEPFKGSAVKNLDPGEYVFNVQATGKWSLFIVRVGS